MSLKKAIYMCLVLIFGIGLSIHLNLLKKKEETKEIANESFLLFSKVKPRLINYLIIKNKGDNISLEKDKDTWKFINERDIPINKKYIEETITFISKIRAKNKINLTKNRLETYKKFGLYNPKLALFFNKEDKEAYIKFGNKHPISNRYYTTTSNSNDIFLIDEAQVRVFNLEKEDFITKHPFKLDIDSIKEFFVNGFNLPLKQFVKEDDGFWHLYTKGEEITADSVLIKEMLNRISELKISNFVTVPINALVGYGLNPAILKLKIKFKDKTKKPLILLFGMTKRAGTSLSAETNLKMTLTNEQIKNSYNEIYKKAVGNHLTNLNWTYYVKDEKTKWVGKISYPIFRAFLKPINEYRNKYILGMIKKEDILKISIKTKNAFYNLSKKKDKWFFSSKVNKKEKEISDVKVKPILKLLKNYKAISFLDGVKEKSFKSNFTIELKLKNYKNNIIIDISKPEGNNPRFSHLFFSSKSPILFLSSHDEAQLLIDKIKRLTLR